jgi:isopropylmalate/homocitrate/citramalate synthase
MLSRIPSSKILNDACKRMLNQNIMSMKIRHPQTFDTSLRDGIQTLNHNNMSFGIKQSIYDKIIREYNPESIEIGSLSSPKILPIMKDTLELYSYAEGIQKKNEDSMRSDNYILIPSLNKLQLALDSGVYNFSFITSVSNEFQKKNTNRTIKDTKKEFDGIFDILQHIENYKAKLYISCINECPIVGSIDNDYIVYEILNYHKNYPFDTFCISDTCGTIKLEDFEYIINNIMFFGIPKEKVSIHLHYDELNLDNVNKILWYCFSKGINNFDVSILDTGRCSVTMPENGRKLRNLDYDTLYSSFSRYLEFKNVFFTNK